MNAADPTGLELRLRCYWTHEWHTGENEPEYPYLHEHYEQFCGDDAATRAAGLVAATNPYYSAGYGYQGAGGGVVFAGAGAVASLGHQGPSCGGAVVNALLTAGTDVAFFTGVGAGIRAARAAGLAGRWVQNFGRAQKLRAMYAAQRAAIARRAARDLAYKGAEAAYLTGRFSELGSTLAGEDLGTPSFSWLDLVPGIASIRAIGKALDACF